MKTNRFMMTALAVMATLPLASCVTGQAEFAALPGEPKLTQAQLIRAQGYCKMRMNDEINRMFARYGAEATLIAGQGMLVEDATACFASQGVMIKGFRQKDDSLRTVNGAIIQPATRKIAGKFPPRPKKVATR